MPAALMPSVSRFALRDVSVMKVFSGAGQNVSPWKAVAVYTTGSTIM